MSKEGTSDWVRRLMGAAEPQQATGSTEGSSEAREGSSATEDSESGSEAEARPLTMNEIIRGRVKRRIDIFGTPPTKKADE
jgi:hypothetical protein